MNEVLGQLQENGRCSGNGPCKEEIAGLMERSKSEGNGTWWRVQGETGEDSIDVVTTNCC